MLQRDFVPFDTLIVIWNPLGHMCPENFSVCYDSNFIPRPIILAHEYKCATLSLIIVWNQFFPSNSHLW